jgi:hypothetical protein
MTENSQTGRGRARARRGHVRALRPAARYGQQSLRRVHCGHREFDAQPVDRGIPRPMGRYAKVISLGLSCQPAAHIREMLGQTEAYFFDWLVTEPEALRATIEHDFEVLRDPEKLSYSDARKIQILDPTTGLMFQHDFPADGEVIRPGYADHVDEVRGKYQRRAARLAAVLNSGAPTLLVRLAHTAVELDEPARDGLAQLVNEKFKGDFTFLWASPAATESRRCRNGYVAALKPDWSHWKGDAASWRKAFEFAGAL